MLQLQAGEVTLKLRSGILIRGSQDLGSPAYLHWVGQQHDLGDGCRWLDGTEWRELCPRGWLQLYFH